jgi:hypothetical protein
MDDLKAKMSVEQIRMSVPKAQRSRDEEFNQTFIGAGVGGLKITTSSPHRPARSAAAPRRPT